VHGGEKITDAILKVAKEFDSRKTRTVVFT